MLITQQLLDLYRQLMASVWKIYTELEKLTSTFPQRQQPFWLFYSELIADGLRRQVISGAV